MCLNFIKTLPQFILPKRALTVFAGFLANCKVIWVKNFLISDFIKRFAVDMTIAEEKNPKAYACFNDFFIRHLQKQYRPIADATIVSPVDGMVSQLGLIQQGQLLQAKGHEYTVEDLLACPPHLAQLFHDGQFATFYLSPKDYHRIHMPIEATLREMIYVPGKLFSVQPLTARTIPKLFARNERLVVFFDTKAGLMAMVLVGAVVVGAIETVWHGQISRGKQKTAYHYNDIDESIMLEKGREMGHFKLGSTVILLFAKRNHVTWRADLQPGDAVCYGQALT